MNLKNTNRRTIEVEISRLKEAREGRDMQLYNEQGTRMVAGGVILNKQKDKILMISSSTKRHKWIIPKGGIELDETDDFAKASLRECWEEAGILSCKSIKFICETHDKAIGKTNNDGFPKARYYFYQLEDVELAHEYPESEKRDRKWCGFDQCIEELTASDRPPLIDAIKASDLRR